MSLKVIKECGICIHDCKQYVDEKLLDKAVLISCPTGKKQEKRK